MARALISAAAVLVALQGGPASARLVAVWYDDTKQVLRLRDPATSKEYELDVATIPRYAKSVPLEPSARIDFLRG